MLLRGVGDVALEARGGRNAARLNRIATSRSWCCDSSNLGCDESEERCRKLKRRILVVEDESAIAEAIKARLTSEGYDVDLAADGLSALEVARSTPPDLVVLDVMLPELDGLEVCREIQAQRWVPVIMVTARSDEADKVAGLAVGADDYITKPFGMRELAARVRAIFRRIDRTQRLGDAAPIVISGLRIDAARRRVFAGPREVLLTPVEFDILRTLAERPGIVLSREQLMELIWGYSDVAGGRVVDSHVARVRKKIGDDAAAPRFIRTVHGVGYSFVEDAGSGVRA